MPPNQLNSSTTKHNTTTGGLMTGNLLTPDLMTSDLMTGNTTKHSATRQRLMGPDGMKLGLFALLLAASGAIFYTNFLHTPNRDAPVVTKEDERAYQDQVRQHEALSEVPGSVVAGS
jgi:hypothetical protein